MDEALEKESGAGIRPRSGPGEEEAGTGRGREGDEECR